MNKLDLKINCTGQILKGKFKSWYVHIEHNLENNGGYLILVFENLDPSKGAGYDSWAEDESTLKEIIKEREWEIKWFDEDKIGTSK